MAGAELLLHFNFAHLPFMATTGLSTNYKSKIRRVRIQMRACKYHDPQSRMKQSQVSPLKLNYLPFYWQLIHIISWYCNYGFFAEDNHSLQWKPSIFTCMGHLKKYIFTFTFEVQRQCIWTILQVGSHTNQVPAKGRNDKHNKAADSSPRALWQ